MCRGIRLGGSGRLAFLDSVFGVALIIIEKGL